MWTVATEVQIYFLFVFCLLPLCRRFGLIVTNVVGLVLGIGLHFLFPRLPAAPWYICLFCFGMTAAVYHKAQRFDSLRRAIPFGVLAATGYAVLLAGALYRVAKGQDMSDSYIWIVDLVNGFLMSCLILFLTVRGGRLRELLETPVMKSLARFSYSLYLFHLPPLYWLASLATRWHLSPVMTTLFVYLVATPMVIVFSYAAFWLVERHFLHPPAKPPVAT